MKTRFFLLNLMSASLMLGCAARVTDPNTGRKVYSSTDRKTDQFQHGADFPELVYVNGKPVQAICHYDGSEKICRFQ